MIREHIKTQKLRPEFLEILYKLRHLPKYAAWTHPKVINQLAQAASSSQNGPEAGGYLLANKIELFFWHMFDNTVKSEANEAVPSELGGNLAPVERKQKQRTKLMPYKELFKQVELEIENPHLPHHQREIHRYESLAANKVVLDEIKVRTNISNKVKH